MQSEVLTLTLGQVDFIAGTLSINEAGAKPAKTAILPLGRRY